MSGLTEQEIKNMRRNRVIMHTVLSRPCEDCRLTWHPLVMTFDHNDRSRKSFTISSKLQVDPIIFDNEIAKCSVVCRNCHQMREYLRDFKSMGTNYRNRDRYKYYARLIPYMSAGALLNESAFIIVPIGKI